METLDERRGRLRENQRRWIKAHPERRVEIMRRHNYGVEPEEYNAKMLVQEDKCAICRKPEEHTDSRTGRIRALSVDHDHLTGKNRGLLCGNCNRGLGLFKENTEVLSMAIQYLKKHKEP